MMKENTPKRPTHRIYAVSPRKNGKSQWTEVGAAWAHADGKGFALKIDYLPLGQGDLVIREPLPKSETTTTEAEAA